MTPGQSAIAELHEEASAEPRSYGHYIDGAWVDGTGNTFDGYDPTTAKAWYTAPEGSADDVDAAVKAARRALESPEWRNLTQTQRGALLRRPTRRTEEMVVDD